MIEGASVEKVQRYGSSIKEHFVSYSGQDFENNPAMYDVLCCIENIQHGIHREVQ